MGIGAVAAGAGLALQTLWSPARAQETAAAPVTPFPGDLINPPQLSSVDGVLDVTMTVGFADFTLPQGPARLRSFNGMMPGPTWRLKPGDQLRVNLRNELPPNLEADICTFGDDDAHVAPNEPNTTNMHFHGLHVSPKGISDNVYLQVQPFETQGYVVDIPENHSVGTFWYHPHRHGSVAIQIASGMAGMLVMDNPLDDNRYPERQLIVQSPEVGPDGELNDPEQFMNLLEENVFTINGQYRPRIHLEKNKPQYWRLLHANDGQFLPLHFDDMGLDAWVIARDGVPTAEPQKTTFEELTPGNRLDLIVVARTPGEYDMVRGAFNQGLLNLPSRLIGTVVVMDSDAPEENPVFPQVPENNRAPQPITDDEISRKREITLSSYTNTKAVDDLAFKINGSPYVPSQFDVVANVGMAEEWEWVNLTPYPHPMHIHVNPFQVTKINGVPVKDPQWVDTFMIPPAGTATFRMRFEDFDGDFVTHCHILPHEDAGMMMNIRILA